MPPTLVHAALGGLLAAALLGPAFTRRRALLVAGAAAVPDLDALLQVVVPYAHGAVLHTLLVPLGAAALLWADERHARRLSARVGAGGVRAAWVAILAYAVAGTGLDLLNVAAANPFYPLTDRFYVVVGKVELSTHDGLVQTFLRGGDGPLGVHRLDAEFCVPSAVRSTCAHPADGRARVVLVESGWQLLTVLSSALALGAAHARSGAAGADAREGVAATTRRAGEGD